MDYVTQQHYEQLPIKSSAQVPKKARERPQLTEATINFINLKRQVLQMVRCATPGTAGGPAGGSFEKLKKEVRKKGPI